jgi:hypothetical protein
LADCRKTVHDLPQWKTNLNFYDDIFQKYIYDGPKAMLGKQISVCLDPDLFGQIRILERAMAVFSLLDSAL